jgi:glutamate/tyrosine decarboxylase-like PLP-dependent enzyme
MLELDEDARRDAWERTLAWLEAWTARLGERPVAPGEKAEACLCEIGAWDFSRAVPVARALDVAIGGLEHGIVPTSHPRYFGTFNPAPATLAVIGQALAAGANPQLATRGHAPFPVAVEERVLRALGARFGWREADTDGVFTSGGAESNLTALELALHEAHPAFAKGGARALSGLPTIYASAEAHPTIGRAARLAGLGGDAVRTIPVDASLRMKVPALREALARDRAAGALPTLIVATAGTTASGSVDPIAEIAAVAEREGAWLHVDAAWGGLAAFVPELAGVLDGIARADSITFDPHKVLSAPMGTGTLLVRRTGALARTFAARAGYVPRRDGEPFAHGLPWSRRFAGLAVFLVLATIGWAGIADALREQVRLAARMRGALRAEGFRLVAESPLPVVLFVDGTREDGDRPAFLERVARRTIASGGGWISVTRLSSGARALRACVDNHRTRDEDVDRLVRALADARA